jgi:hypothetical protein
LLLYSWLAVTQVLNTEELPSLTQASPMRLELRWHSSGMYVVVSPNTRTNFPHSVITFF